MIKGINYDTGFLHAGTSTHEPFRSEAVAGDMRVIRRDLGCDAVRISGGDPERLEIAARHAATAGLEVWWTPFLCDVSPAEARATILDCAGRAERLRQDGGRVVFLVGAELSVFVAGFLPGEGFRDRVELLTADASRRATALAELPGRLNAFLSELTQLVRARFGGPVGYCSLPFEQVDWTPFDWVASDAGYRSTEDDATVRSGIRALRAHGRPVAITEFGATTRRGAALEGGHGADIVVYDGAVPTGLDGDYERNEQEQADYLLRQLTIFQSEGIDAAFVYTFANFHLPRRCGRWADLDLASAGIVSVRDEPGPGPRWSPKIAFDAYAAYAADANGAVDDG